MAKRGTSKWHSILHEDFIAAAYGGRRSRTSGAADHEDGDVVCDEVLIECKMSGVKSPAKSASVKLDVLEKIAAEAYSVGKTPLMALRMRNPESFLADRDGFVDVMVRLVRDDAA